MLMSGHVITNVTNYEGYTALELVNAFEENCINLNYIMTGFLIKSLDDSLSFLISTSVSFINMRIVDWERPTSSPGACWDLLE